MRIKGVYSLVVKSEYKRDVIALGISPDLVIQEHIKKNLDSPYSSLNVGSLLENQEDPQAVQPTAVIFR